MFPSSFFKCFGECVGSNSSVAWSLNTSFAYVPQDQDAFFIFLSWLCFFSSILHDSSRIILCVWKRSAQEYPSLTRSDSAWSEQINWWLVIALVLSWGFIFVFYHNFCCNALEWCNREIMHSQPQFLSLRERKCKFCLVHSFFVFTFLPALFYNGSSTFTTGSLLFSAQTMKVTVLLLCGWIRDFSQAVMRRWVTFAVGMAEAGVAFCLCSLWWCLQGSE